MPTKSEKMQAQLGQPKSYSSSEHPLYILTCNAVLLLATRFLYDGDRIQEDDTPAILDMEDNGMFAISSRIATRLQYRKDTIDVMVEREWPSFYVYELYLHGFLVEVGGCT